ncbi:S-layer homology domain-containing protein [Paenibacillus planticolens]|nr:S-layer homology domain-containing protein [Paenibacillus planticolens]
MKSKITKLLLIMCLLVAFLVPLSAVNAASAEPSTGTTPFKDMENHWASQVVKKWYNHDWIQGYSNDLFGPARQVTRAEVVTLLYRAFEMKSKGTASPYPDVKKNDWFHNAIAAAYEHGYVQGYPDGLFHPGEPITRNELMVMIYRVLEPVLKKDMATLGGFTDETELPSWAKDSVHVLKQLGIINGYEDGTFQGFNKVTRAEAVVALDRALERFQEAGKTEPPNSGNTPTSGTPGISNPGGGGGGGVGGNGGSSGGGSGTKPEKAVVTYMSGVTSVSDSTARTLDHVSGDGTVLEFQGDSPELAALRPDQILILPASSTFPTGNAVKIVSVQTDNQKTVLHVKKAQLEEVFKVIQINQNVPISPEDFILEEGVTLEKVMLEPKAPARYASLKIDPGMLQYAASIETGLKFKVSKIFEKTKKVGPLDDELSYNLSFNGEFTLANSANFDIDWDIFSGVKSMTASLETKRELAASVAGTAKFKMEDKSEMPKVLVGTIPRIQLGTTPFSLKMQLFIVMNLTGEASLAVEYSKSEESVMGFIYTKEDGFKEIALPDKESKKPTKVSLEGKIKQEILLSTEVNLEAANFDLITLELQAGIQSELSGKYSADTGGCAKMQISGVARINVKTGDDLKKLLDVELEIYDSVTPPFWKVDTCLAIASISVDHVATSLAIGDRENISVKAKTLEGEEVDVSGDSEYISSNPDLVSVDEYGTIYVKDAAQIGDQVDITVKNRNKEANVKVTVDIGPLKVEPSMIRLKPGQSEQLVVKAQIRPNEWQDVTHETGILYEAGNSALLSVSNAGLVQAAATLLEDTVPVNITYRSRSAKVYVSVKQDPRDIVRQAEAFVNHLMQANVSRSKPQNFKGELLAYYSDGYIDKIWRKVFEHDPKWYLEPNFLYPLTEAEKSNPGYSASIREEDGKSYVNVVLTLKKPIGNVKEIHYEYVLVKRNGMWYLDDLRT